MSTRDPALSTSDRILNAALASFASRGYDGTSLDALAKGLELTKQSILYWFPSKDAVLEAVIARSAADLSDALETALRGAGAGWVRVEAVVRSVFRLAARQPELLGLLREVSRSGPPGGDPDDRWRSSPWCGGRRPSWRLRWTPARCVGMTHVCSSSPSTPR